MYVLDNEKDPWCDELSHLQTEIAPPKIRGFLVGLTQQFIGIGFIVANWVSELLQPCVALTQHQAGWVWVPIYR
jgi:hypothetical protein